MSSADISKIEAGNLFNVNGLVAVVTGAGSGECNPSSVDFASRAQDHDTLSTSHLYRNTVHDHLVTN